jgi:hypothetical protein
MTIQLLLEDGTTVVIEYTEMGETGIRFRKWIDGELFHFNINLTDDELRDARKALWLMEKNYESH